MYVFPPFAIRQQTKIYGNNMHVSEPNVCTSCMQLFGFLYLRYYTAVGRTPVDCYRQLVRTYKLGTSAFAWSAASGSCMLYDASLDNNQNLTFVPNSGWALYFDNSRGMLDWSYFTNFQTCLDHQTVIYLARSNSYNCSTCTAQSYWLTSATCTCIRTCIYSTCIRLLQRWSLVKMVWASAAVTSPEAATSSFTRTHGVKLWQSVKQWRSVDI